MIVSEFGRQICSFALAVHLCCGSLVDLAWPQHSGQDERAKAHVSCRDPPPPHPRSNARVDPRRQGVLRSMPWPRALAGAPSASAPDAPPCRGHWRVGAVRVQARCLGLLRRRAAKHQAGKTGPENLMGRAIAHSERCTLARARILQAA